MDSRWRVQSTWRLDGHPKSYAPVFVDTESEARSIAAEMRSTLWYFVDLEVSVREVDARIAADEQAANNAGRESERPPTTHLMSGSPRLTACGVPIDTANSAMSRELWPLSSGNKCVLCHDMISAL